MIRLLRKEWAVAVLFLEPSLIGFSIFYLIPFVYIRSWMDGIRVVNWCAGNRIYVEKYRVQRYFFLAGLQSIPKDYYKTADIQGAGRQNSR